MANVKDIRDYFEQVVPSYMKFDFDNVGMLVGFCDAEVRTVVVSLDITDAVIEEAEEIGAQLIVSHHPLLFDPLKRVTDDDPKGRKVIRLIQDVISAICLHTNLDTAEGGVNDCLMETLGARVTGLLDPHGAHPDGTPYGVSRLGELAAPVEFQDFLVRTKQRLHSGGLRYVDGGRPVFRIACCGGAGGRKHRRNNCVICGKPLVYFAEETVLECRICHKRVRANAACEDGHFVCDECHSGGGAAVLELLLHSAEKDPIALLLEVFRLEDVHLHGPEHHGVVPCVLLTAYHNCGGQIDLARVLPEA